MTTGTDAASTSAVPSAAPPVRTARRRRIRRLWWVLGTIVGIAVAGGIVTSVTPWPSALLIRAVFEHGGTATAEEMDAYVPDAPLREIRDVAYADGSSTGEQSTTLDVFTPAAEAHQLPTIVWIHGGAWISGSVSNVEPYLRILAAEGYTAVGVGYGYGPETVYPTAVRQIEEALAYLEAHAAELSIDPSRIVLAGDSAGAQLASQIAALSTNPGYADLMGVEPALRPDQISGVLLNCGVYDLRAMAELQGTPAWGFKVALWAYTGTRDWSQQSSGSTMSTIQFVTSDFPPTYISGGNGDGLTWLQSIPMAQRLEQLDVPVTDLFWPATHEPQLPHEYQFHLDSPAAQEALSRTLDWLEDTTRT